MGSITINPYEEGPKKSLNKDIKTQDKEIEITSNGTTEVTPDPGFNALNSVSVNVNVPQSGGTELEGEYFLAKPNGRYWKSKLAVIDRGKYPAVMGLKSNFTEVQLESLTLCAEIFSFCAFSAIGNYGGIPSSGYEVLFQLPRVAGRCANNANSIYIDDHLDLLGAWQECDFTMLIPGSTESVNVNVNGLVGLMRLSSEGALDGASDDEVLAMVSEMLMIEQVTKEEYESWYNW